MEVPHLDRIFSILGRWPKNTYPTDIEVSVYENWIAAARRFGCGYEVQRDSRGYPYTSIFHKTGELAGVIEPALLPGCPVSSRRICNNKVLTSDILRSRGVRVPRSWTFTRGDAKKARAMVFEGRREVVVKAPSLSLGKGVFLNVTEENFLKAFDDCVALQGGARQRVVVEEMHPGFEMRATVIEGRLHHVLLRIPAYVVGDGTSSIQELVALKNEERAVDGFLGNKPLKSNANMGAQMNRAGVTFQTVPDEGQRVLLSSMSNTLYGGETAVVTDLVSEEIRDIALRSVAAIPGVTTAGCDVMANSFEDRDPLVLEVNTFPHAQLALFPTYGQSVDPFVDFLRAFFVRDGCERGKASFSQEDLAILGGYLRFYALRDSMESEARV